MTETPFIDPPAGPILLWAGTDPAAGARLAETAAALLSDRPAAVVATWPSLTGLAAGADVSVDLGAGTYAQLREAAREAADEAARSAAAALEARGLQVTLHVRPEEHSLWRAILEVADELGAAVIVAGTSQGAAARREDLGREARALAHRARRPLLLVTPDGSRPGDDAPAIFATDGSPSACHAVAAGGALLRPRPALAAGVWRTVADAIGAARLGVPDAVAREGADRLDEEARRRAAEEAGAGADLLTEAGWPAEATAIESTRGVAAAVVTAAGERDAAVIVTGTRGRSRIAAALLGSTAEGVLRHAGRPVLLVPPAADA